jgi:hypothetical protein
MKFPISLRIQKHPTTSVKNTFPTSSSSLSTTFARTYKLHSSTTMAPLPSKAGSLLKACPRRPLQCLNPAFATSQQRRTKADIVDRVSGQYDTTPKFESPFKTKEENPTTKIPSFANYMSKKGETTNKTFQYFMVGGMGLLAAAGAKATVQGRHGHYTGGILEACQN